MENPPVRFRRTAGMAALPLPERGGSIAQLWSFVNLTDDSFVLYVNWILDALYPGRPPSSTLFGGRKRAQRRARLRRLHAA
jgi:hypothetical protein